MKINTYVEWQWDGQEYVEVHCESYEHDGEVSECKGGGGGTQTTTQTSEPWSGQKPYLTQSYGDIANLQEQQFYPNQTYVGRNPLEYAADAQRLTHAQQVMPGQVQEAQDGWLGLMNSLDVGNNQYVNGMMDANARSMTKNLTQQVMPGIRNNSISNGQYGSSRQGIAEGMAIQGAQDALANSNAATQMDAYGKGLESLATGLEFAPQMLNLGLQPANITEFVGQGIREDQSQALADDMARWNFAQSEPERLVQLQSQLLNGGMQFGTTTGTSPNPYQRSGFQDALGTAASIAGIVSMF